tara:strand:- start:21525 stop:21896 length:372 start_codon:yes stop_codon:yes gene_type:complete
MLRIFEKILKMKFLLFISLFLFLLATEMNVCAIDHGCSCENRDTLFQLIEEEETEIETVTVFVEDVTLRLGGSFGGNSEVTESTCIFVSFIGFISNIKFLKKGHITILKNPRYIRFCSLKLHC